MFGLGFGEIMIILVLALLLLGPKKLPEAAKTIGKGLREFRKATDDLRGQIETEINVLDQDKPPPKPALVPGSRPSIAGPVLEATVDNVPGLDAAVAEAPPAAPAAPAVTSGEPQPGQAAPAAGSAPEAVKTA